MEFLNSIKKFEDIFNSMTELIAVQDTENNIIWANDVAAKSTGFTKEKLKGMKCYQAWRNREIPCKSCPVREAIKTGELKKLKVTTEKEKHFSITGFPLKNIIGEVEGAIELTTELTEEVKSKDALKKSEKWFRSLFNNSIDGIYITTPKGEYADANPALVKMLGYNNKDELMAIDIINDLYVSKDDRPTAKQRDRIFKTKLKKKDSSIIDVEISSRVISENGKPKYYQGIVRDITDRKKAENKLKYLSFHDSLTGLYNKAYFEEELKRLDTKRQLPLSIIVGDVNNLKLINDTFGHLEGDKFLRHIALLLKKFSRKEDIVARWGGDELCIILPKTTKQSAEKKVKKIRRAYSKDNNSKIPISISFGIATKKSSSQDIKDIFQMAEDNMYKSKLMDKKSSFDSILKTLEKALHEKSMETEKHSKRLKKYAIKLGKALNLSENNLKDLSLLASLHDIGKVAIPKAILQKKSKLTKKEFEIIQKHSEAGHNIVQSIPQFAHLANAILSHHERWDGLGYPQGIRGTEIPLLSRIISIVDSYDIMRQHRPYKKAKNKQEAIAELKKGSGIKFDPKLVKKFIGILTSF